MSKTISISCLCCESKEFRFFRKMNGFELFRCGKCGFVRVHPLPDFSQLAAHYNDTRTNADQKEARAKLLPAFIQSKNNPKRDFFDSVLKKSHQVLGKDKLDILEIGAGFGYFIHYANEKGEHAIGTEVTSEYAAMGSDTLNGQIIHVENDQYSNHFAPASFDLIYMEHVFEHVLDPEKILSQIKMLLRPGGVFFIAVPNLDSLVSKVQGKFWAWAAPPDHLYFYNPVNLPLLLKRSGFDIEEVSSADYYHRSIPQLYSLRRILNIFRKLSGMKPKPYRYVYPENIGDYLLRLPYYIFYPFIRSAAKRNKGSELIIFARCRG